MNNLFLIIIGLYLLLSPFYIFASGSPQPSDFIVAFGSLLFLVSGRLNDTFKYQIVRHLIRFVLVVIMVNMIYFFYFYFKSIENRMYMPVFFYIFNFSFYLFFFSVIKSVERKTFNWIGFFIVLSLLIQCTLALLGFQGGFKETASSRAVLFFNNPNQLGYYALLMLSLFTVLPSWFRHYKPTMVLTIIMTSYLVLLSNSRAALAGIIVLIVIILIKEGIKFKTSAFILIFALIALLPIFFESDFFQQYLTSLEVRNQRHENTSISQAQIRGYDRMWIHPEYLIYGAGEGKYDRFDSYHNLEMHSGIGTIIFSYGIAGFVLFVIFLYQTVKHGLFLNLMLISPILIYNLTHQGLRNSLLWIIFATIYITTYHSKQIKSLKKIYMYARLNRSTVQPDVPPKTSQAASQTLI